MAVITPSTDLKLLKVPLEINDINQLTFANQTAQFNYFNSLSQYDVDDDFTYQRYDGTIRFPAQYDEILTYNYVMYKNTAYSDKWFYAFITNIEYVNDNMTAITIKTDVWQTWQFDLTYKPVLIDREHANTDVPGDNLLPEQLELGEFVVNGTVRDFGNTSDEYCTIIDVTMIENEGESSTLRYEWDDGQSHNRLPIVNGMPSGVIHLIDGYYAHPTDGIRSPQNVITVYDVAGLGEAIVNIYPYPKSLIGQVYPLTLHSSGGQSSAQATGLAIPADSFTEYIDPTPYSFTKPTSIDGYTPKNKKLLTFPYCYFDISNNGGMAQPYHYEDFSSSNCVFKVASALTVSGSIKAYPIDYKNISNSENSYDYGVTGAKYPLGAWINDSYTNWLTQNAVNMKVEWAKTLIGAGIGVVSGGYQGYQAGKEVGAASKFGTLGVVGGAIQGVGSIINTALDQHIAKTQANLVPDQTGGSNNCGDITWAKNRCKFTYLPMSIKAQFARCLDEFFSQYGYKCNRVKLPNITGRRNWNYVKTIGCYIEADIPQNDLAEIKAMFDNGITLWHNPSTFADYSQNNDII